ncbi:hypothetical protein C8Q70DRAFT_170240 [Cubamyces menziesii]|nr:hypothetical protein C8Q70DRAFT_170240 [Cubamyces menziesii]
MRIPVQVCPQCLVQRAHPSVHCIGASTNSRCPCAFWPRQPRRAFLSSYPVFGDSRSPDTHPCFVFDGNANRDPVNVTADSDPSCSMRRKWPLQECILCGATMNNRRWASSSQASSAAAWTIASSSLTSRPRARREGRPTVPAVTTGELAVVIGRCQGEARELHAREQRSATRSSECG